MNRFLTYWRPWLLLAACLGGVGVFLVFNFYQEHARIESVERERLATQSKVIEDNLSRQLVAMNLTLESVTAELPYWAAQPDGHDRAIRWLKSMEASMPSVRTFLVLDARGTVTLSNREELIGRNFVQREYFRVHAQSKNRKLLHVSAPFQSVLNTYVINLTRAIVDPRGEFAGVVSATVDPVDIQILLNSVRYAEDMRSMLVHGDGQIFVSQPALTEVIGKNVSVPGSFFRQHLASKRPVSHFEGLAISSGDKRLSVLRTIQPVDLAMDKPLLVSLSRGWGALFANWQRDIRNQLLVYLLLVLLSAVGLSGYLRQRVLQRVSDQRLKLATEASGVGIWEVDLKSRRNHWDAAMFELFGLDPQSVNAQNDDWKQLLLPGELDRIRAATRTAIQQRQAFDLTFQVRRQDGQLRFMRNRAALHADGTGTPTRMIGTTEDVTERKLREADLRIAATAFESHESMIITDAQAVILRVNHAFVDLFGYTADEALGQTPRILQSGRHEPAFYAALWAGIKNAHAWQGEIWNRRKNGDVFPVWLCITAVCSEEGVVTHYVATHTDITLRKAADEEIKHLAFYDPLTHLPNRRLLQDRLHQAVAHAKRDSRRLGLLFIDLDQFKPVNDEFGHKAGDELLQAVAHRLQACVRESDTVARIGGDEFMVLLPSIEVAQDATGVAEKIHAMLKQPFTLAEGQTVSISSSAGIAIYPEHGRDEATLTSHADTAMYQAKTAGRDRFVLFQAAH
ncbi:MAG: diguanylate cyclase [Rhodoferax sp.]|uniref:diguanylate cyclase domain-containing protein n=1 Tax=Rhodoferax sp. TaxID=50421 RepID=UPI0017BC9E1B|nr:diguanylate cyclase [Rhodoferax sp.]NMM19059.1 diguanylate cyclase [Rhodoferax sp.]